MEAQIKIPFYNANLSLVSEISSLIKNKYNNLFVIVIVHGSVATDEVVKFSDFDGLLIVKDEFVNSKELKKFKKETFERILTFDPLQHHGWFQISESELKNYPESYLPHEILKHSRLIYPLDGNIDLDIKINTRPDYQKGLMNMLNSFENRIKNKWEPKNVYQLKSVLSQVMLIPSLYYSAKNNKGIFKKYSFDAVRQDFNDEEWYAINKASEIRNIWQYKLNYLQRFIMLRPERVYRKIAQRYLAPKISDDFKLDKLTYQSLELLILKIKKLLNETH